MPVFSRTIDLPGFGECECFYDYDGAPVEVKIGDFAFPAAQIEGANEPLDPDTLATLQLDWRLSMTENRDEETE